MKKFIALLLVLVMALSLVACAKPADDANTPADGETEGPKTLIMGTSADYAPFEFMYPNEAGDMVYGGIDVFAAEYIAAELGVELQIENMGFDYLLTSMAKGDFDFVIAAMEATEERLNSADFSDPYYTDVPPMLLVRKADAEKFTSLSAFDGLLVTAQAATTKQDLVTEMMPNAKLGTLQLVTDMVNELVHEKTDALMLDGAVAMEYEAANADLVALTFEELGTAAPYCIAVQKGDPKGLLPGINAAIAKMTAENKVPEFIARADELSGVAQEVTADAPAA